MILPCRARRIMQILMTNSTETLDLLVEQSTSSALSMFHLKCGGTTGVFSSRIFQWAECGERSRTVGERLMS